MCRCSVLSDVSSDHMAAFAEMLSSIKRHAHGSNLHACVFFGVFFGSVLFCFLWSIVGHFDRVHCTLCEEKEDEPNSGVQQMQCSI